MPTRPISDDPPAAPLKIGPDDPRYTAVVDKRFNKRFTFHLQHVNRVKVKFHLGKLMPLLTLVN